MAATEREEVRNARAEMEVLRHLVASAAWGLVRRNIEEQLTNRDRELLDTPVRSIEEIASFNMKQGIRLGLKLALEFPGVMIEERQEIWQQALEEQRNEHGSERRTDSEDPLDWIGGAP